MFGAEADGVFQLNGAFVGEPPDAEHFGGAADQAVTERWHGERDEDQPAGLRKLEMPPDRDLRLFPVKLLRSAVEHGGNAEIPAQREYPFRYEALVPAAVLAYVAAEIVNAQPVRIHDWREHAASGLLFEEASPAIAP